MAPKIVLKTVLIKVVDYNISQNTREKPCARGEKYISLPQNVYKIGFPRSTLDL